MKKFLKYFKTILCRYSVFRALYWGISESAKASTLKYSPEMFKEFGRKVLLDDNVQISHPDRVIIKDNCVIHSGAIINSLGGLIIGTYSAIGYNATIFTVEHRFRGANAIPFDDTVFLKPVIIGDYVIMGINVSICPGVEIGEGAILGMGSVVTKDVPACAIVLGNPAQIIGHRNKEHFEKLKRDKMFQFQAGLQYKEEIMPIHRKRRKDIYNQLGF